MNTDGYFHVYLFLFLESVTKYNLKYTNGLKEDSENSSNPTSKLKFQINTSLQCSMSGHLQKESGNLEEMKGRTLRDKLPSFTCNILLCF